MTVTHVILFFINYCMNFKKLFLQNCTSLVTKKKKMYFITQLNFVNGTEMAWKSGNNSTPQAVLMWWFDMVLHLLCVLQINIRIPYFSFYLFWSLTWICLTAMLLKTSRSSNTWKALIKCLSVHTNTSPFCSMFWGNWNVARIVGQSLSIWKSRCFI